MAVTWVWSNASMAARVSPETPAAPARTRAYTGGEELANAATHGLGAASAVAGLSLLVVFAVRHGDRWCLASAIVYGLSLVLLYAASTLYHGLPQPRAKHVFQILDHASIYLLIAGSYTPFTLITLRPRGGYWMFGLIWGLALAGVAAEAFWVHRPKWLSALVYVGLGWLAVFMLKPLAAELPRPGLWLLVAGGLAYTLGTAFYMLKRQRFAHAVWHLFVLGGSTCHFLSIFLFVLPPV
jgi:hemolysin III